LTVAAKAKARAIFARLGRAYPGAHCELEYQGTFQLLAAVILSAQCTDKAVNKATPGLFKAYPGPQALAKAPSADVERHIRTLGLYRNKARSLVGMAQALVRDHGSEVPGTLEALVALPGVGRKTANVVLSEGFHRPGLAVDTHVLRKAEAVLCGLLPSRAWAQASHRLIWHGRRVCAARNPRCQGCPVEGLCPSAGKA